MDVLGSTVWLIESETGGLVCRQVAGICFDVLNGWRREPGQGGQKGMGLGISTSYAIVEKHGGHIAVDSTPGSGTTVHIYLPVESRSEKIHGNPTSRDVSSPPVRRVLLMDDEEMIREMASQMLKRQGYAVETVKDGVEALEA